MPHRKAARICIHMEMHRTSVQGREQARGTVPREPKERGVRAETEKEQKDARAETEMERKHVRAETEMERNRVHSGTARGAVSAEIREHVSRAAAREAVFRESVPVCVRAAARETVPSGTVTGTVTVTEIMADRALAAGRAAQGVRAQKGMTGILLPRLWWNSRRARGIKEKIRRKTIRRKNSVIQNLRIRAGRARSRNL